MKQWLKQFKLFQTNDSTAKEAPKKVSPMEDQESLKRLEAFAIDHPKEYRALIDKVLFPQD